MTLVAVKTANAGDEIFNNFGEHGNALLLHKYGFCEWDNTHGGVTISHETLFKVLGPEVIVEAEAALDGDAEMDTEADAEQSHEGIGFGPQKLPWERTDDATSKGAAMARAAGWVGSQYEISASGEPSRDLILLLATAPPTRTTRIRWTRPPACPRTWARTTRPSFRRSTASRRRCSRSSRRDARNSRRGERRMEISPQRRSRTKRQKNRMGTMGRMTPQNPGASAKPPRCCSGRRSAWSSRRGCCGSSRALRAAGGGGGVKPNVNSVDVPARTDSPGLAQPIQSTPYGSVVYLPRRGPKPTSGMDKAYEKPASPNHPHPGLGSDVFGLPDPGEREDEQ